MTRSQRDILLALGAALVVSALLAFGPSGDGHDQFGVEELYPSAEDGMSWAAKWEQGEVLDDPWLQQGSGDISYTEDAGVLSISGRVSRLYIREPAKQRQWRDVEVTVYAKRIADNGVPYSGIVSAVRINHGVTGPLEDNPCDSRGLTARLRFDGNADFGKETSHPTTIATDPVEVFPGGLPRDRWIGYKHVVYDIASGTGTHQELWMDLNEGRNGGNWQLVASHDDLVYSDFGEIPCTPGIDPGIPYVNGPRAGSESGLPSIAVLLRADELQENGLQYKWASVREIIGDDSESR